MDLILKRTRLRDTITTGQLYIDGVYFCFTLEDKVREQIGIPVQKWKVFGETAIPYGVYKIILEDSPKFGPETLTINKVDGFTGVRMHAGNTQFDTDGCIIVGYRVRDDGIIVPGTTKPAVADLKKLVKQATDVTLKIIT